MRRPPRRWVPATPTSLVSRRDLRARQAEEADLKRDIRWRWNEFCSGVDLTHRIIPTGFATREPPRLGPITLGPPTRFNIELRPGQLIQDLLDVRERLAAAYQVADADVLPLVPGWVTVLLIEEDADRVRSSPLEPEDRAERGPRRGEIRPNARHLPPRRHRGPYGSPRLGPRRID